LTPDRWAGYGAGSLGTATFAISGVSAIHVNVEIRGAKGSLAAALYFANHSRFAVADEIMADGTDVALRWGGSNQSKLPASLIGVPLVLGALRW